MVLSSAIYLRSPCLDVHEERVDRQLRKCRSAAADNGLRIVAELIDDPIINEYDRTHPPGYDELMRLIESGTVATVVLSRADDLSVMNGLGYPRLLQAIEAGGGDLGQFALADGLWLTSFDLCIRAAIDHDLLIHTLGRTVGPSGHRPARRLHADRGHPRTENADSKARLGDAPETGHHV